MEYQKRVKTPTIIQMEATECGASALSIILAYYKRYLTAEEARIACGVSRDGSKAINIVKAARKYGMEAYGANLELEELDAVDVPFIIYWEFNHFMVVEGYSKKKVFVNDPAFGPRTMTWEVFDKGYTGVVLDIKPGKIFKPGGMPSPSTLRMAFEKLGHNKNILFYLFLITLALVIPKVAAPIFTKAYIDEVLINQQTALFKVIALGLLFTTTAAAFITWVQKKILSRLMIKLDLINIVNFLWHLLHIPMHYFQQRASGDIVERSFISEKVAAFLAKDVAEVAISLIEIFLIFIVICLQSIQLGLILIFILTINFTILRISEKKFTDLSLVYAQDLGKLEAIQVYGIEIIESIKIAALEQHFFNRWISFYTKLAKNQARILWLDSLLTTLPTVLSLFLNLVIICYGAVLVISGAITVGTIVAIQALAVTIMFSVNSIVVFINRMRQLKGGIVRLNDVMDTKVDPLFNGRKKRSKAKALTLSPSKIILETKNISYGYSPLEPPVLSDISLEIKQGQQVAIVGPSGSGKSSFGKLVCGLMQPWSGEILMNNVPLNSCNRNDLSQLISYVNPNILFIKGTLRDNLTLWDTTISDEEIYEALIQTGLYKLVMDRGGLSMTLSDTAFQFSGGQKQCIEIARALLRKPKLLILDEATSALDPIWENKIYESLRPLNCSILIIAHRISAITNCDKIYVLDSGEFVQAGRHRELIKEKGLYRDLMSNEGI